MPTVEEQVNRLAGVRAFDEWYGLRRPPRMVYTLIGLYSQLAATADFHLRRIYFGFLSDEKNKRGTEKTTLTQIFQRLPKKVQQSKIDLYRKAEFPLYLTEIETLLKARNDVVHASCRWQVDGNLLVFAHVNERVGAEIRTGNNIAFFVIALEDFRHNVKTMERMIGYLPQYSFAWLPKLRPWLPSSWNGTPDPGGQGSEEFFSAFDPSESGS